MHNKSGSFHKLLYGYGMFFGAIQLTVAIIETPVNFCSIKKVFECFACHISDKSFCKPFCVITSYGFVRKKPQIYKLIGAHQRKFSRNKDRK